MKKIITIGREYCSGGTSIGKLVAGILNVPFYDKEIIDMAIGRVLTIRDNLDNKEDKDALATIINFACQKLNEEIENGTRV